ncbi:Protein gir2 [Elasticomyces elasticus]|nr:Protein gir2 [Elasticomyces elasticus]KAK3624780.1 Protein gir2 [Elasticomyces elasticus]KAK4925390.1 Protein gir2 [Elasticomyces elasticus]KAK5744859.1 Protein gir2 [Elasticomyces elasticus]
MGRDEQKEEREVLDSIFPDEIQDVNDAEYRVAIALDVKKEDEDESPDPVILLNIRYPEAYPDEAPRLDITQPPNAARYEHLDVQEDKVRLLEALQPTIEESMGMAMVFTLVSALKDAAELLISERQQAIQALKDIESAKAEEEENRKFEGEKVTRESFLAWREKFRQEMAEEAARRQAELEAEEKKKRGPKEEKKLSGKQLWQQGLAGNTIDEEQDEGDDALEGMQKLKVES